MHEQILEHSQRCQVRIRSNSLPSDTETSMKDFKVRFRKALVIQVDFKGRTIREKHKNIDNQANTQILLLNQI